jgi:parallel beta-helix repeat protein
MKRKFGIAAVMTAAVMTFAAPVSGGGRPIVVDDDGSDCPNRDFATITEGVGDASPGDTILVCPGTYHERVTISTSGLTLRAKGAPGDVVVDGDIGPAGTAALHLVDVSGVTIEGFTVREGHEADILLDNADGNTIRKNVTTAAGHDGIELRLASAGNLIEHNVAIDNLAFNACGIQIRDAGSTGNLVRHNETINNNWGIRIGLGATGNVVFDNLSLNNRFIGILNFAGGNDNVIESNQAFGNPTGISIQGSSGVTVARNHAFGNTLDLFWDGSGANTFVNNHCNTSTPSGLCAHTEGEGDSGQ